MSASADLYSENNFQGAAVSRNQDELLLAKTRAVKETGAQMLL